MVLRKSVIFTLLVCFALVSPCLAAKGGSKVDDAVKAVVEQHGKALSAQDLKGVMNTYAPVPGIFLMGTGPGETYVGDEAVGGAYHQFFTRFKANTLTFKYDWIHIGSKGDVAWFGATAAGEAMINNEKRERTFNLSGTLEKVKGKWGFVSLHFSRLGVEQTSAEQKAPEQTSPEQKSPEQPK